MSMPFPIHLGLRVGIHFQNNKLLTVYVYKIPLGMLETRLAPINNLGRKTQLLFTEESLPDLQWQNLQE